MQTTPEEDCTDLDTPINETKYTKHQIVTSDQCSQETKTQDGMKLCQRRKKTPRFMQLKLWRMMTKG